MMYCKKCGNDVRIDDVFCDACGERLNHQATNKQESIHNSKAIQKELNDESLEIEDDVHREAPLEPEVKTMADEVLCDLHANEVVEVAKEETATTEECILIQESELITVDDFKQDKQKKKTKKSKGMRVWCMVGAVFIGGLSTFFAYTQMALYPIEPVVIALDTYLKDNYDDLLEVYDDEIRLYAQEELINGYLTQNKELLDNYIGNGVTVDEVQLIVDEQKLLLNAKWKGLNVPVGIAYSIESHKDAISVKIEKLDIGSANLPLPKALVTTSLGKKSLEIPLKDIFIEGISLKDIENDKDEIVIYLDIDNHKLLPLIKKVKSNFDEEILNTYCNLYDEKYYLVGELFTNPQEDHLLNVLNCRDLKGVCEAVIGALNTEELKKFEATYGEILAPFVGELDLMTLKQKSIKSLIINQAKIVFEDLNDEGYRYYLVSNKNHFYDTYESKYLSVAELMNAGVLGSDASIFDHVLWENGESFAAIYGKGEGSVYVNDEGNYEILTQEAYDAYTTIANAPVTQLSASNAERQLIEACIKNYGGKDYRTRYLSSDGEYAYVLVSPQEEQAYFEQFILKKEGNWKVLNVFDEYAYIDEEAPHCCPQMNLDVLPPFDLSQYYFPVLTSYDLGYLKEQIFYSTDMAIEEIEIDFATFCNGVVYMYLTNGKEFIYNDTNSYIREITSIADRENSLKDSDLGAFMGLQP